MHLYVAAWIDDAVAVFSVATVSSPTPVPSVSQWGLWPWQCYWPPWSSGGPGASPLPDKLFR